MVHVWTILLKVYVTCEVMNLHLISHDEGYFEEGFSAEQFIVKGYFL